MNYPIDIVTEAEDVLLDNLCAVLLNTRFEENVTAEEVYDTLSQNLVYVAVKAAKEGKYTGMEMTKIVQEANHTLWMMFRDEMYKEA